jgi:hypothetical protein
MAESARIREVTGADGNENLAMGTQNAILNADGCDD